MEYCVSFYKFEIVIMIDEFRKEIIYHIIGGKRFRDTREKILDIDTLEDINNE